MAAEPDGEEMLFHLSSQSKHEDECNGSDDDMLDAFQGDEWNGSDDEILNAFQSGNHANLPYASEGDLDDLPMLSGSSPGAPGDQTKCGSAVPNRYCVATSHASVSNLC
jgi:hypothetical protein